MESSNLSFFENQFLDNESGTDDDHYHAIENNDDLFDELLNEYADYGSTPTRTRIARKTRDWKKWEKEQGVYKGNSPKIVVSKGNHEKAASFDHCSKDCSIDDLENYKGVENKSRKRSLKLLRGSERDFKLDLNDVSPALASVSVLEKAKAPDLSAPNFKVETCKPFMCLSSKLVLSRKQGQHLLCNINTSVSQDRINFYQNLLRYGNCEKLYGQEHLKQQCMETEIDSPMNDVWQSELKDLLWLELQAYIADRTPSEQDQYFCKEREKVGALLQTIMDFKFESPPCPTSLNPEDADNKNHTQWCLQMFCALCTERHNKALRQVESLLRKLEHAVSLFPSSRTFGTHYPLYSSPQFTSRVKAMCLWYNITKHLRLKFLILCKHLIHAEEGEFPNPKHLSSSSSTGSNPSSLLSNPSSSNQSDETSVDGDYDYNSGVCSIRIGEKHYEIDFYDSTFSDLLPYFSEINLSPAGSGQSSPYPCNAYRKYIKSVLKTKGIKTAFNFIEKLENTILRKIRWSLMELSKEDQIKIDEIGTNADINEELEMKRFGVWSHEAAELNLPSYRAAFIFLARIPFDVIHTFLLMRLCMRPEKPHIMSIRQLMYELKEGLRLSVLVRQQYLEQFETATGNFPTYSKIDSNIASFDQTTQNVLEVYLEYLFQWVTMIQQEQIQKNILEEEWNFVKNISPHIPGGQALVGSRFCMVASTIFKAVDSHLCTSVEKAISRLSNVETHEIKHEMFHVCRWLQCLCIKTREKALRSIVLVKILRKDLENSDLENGQPSLYCNVITDSLVLLKKEAFNLCGRIKEIILLVEESFVFPVTLDETDNCAMQSRMREVLNQFYKFAFEYYKEVFKMLQNCLHAQFADCMIELAQSWINFVKERCERGRGLKPKWATHGLEFLLTACDPQLTNHLSDESFKLFKSAVEDVVEYIVGSEVDSPHVCSKVILTPSSQHQNSSPPVLTSSTNTPRFRRRDLNHSSSTNTLHTSSSEKRLSMENCENTSSDFQFERVTYRERVQLAVKVLDNTIEKRLKSGNKIGDVCETYSIPNYSKYHTITFSWQRGIKIGQGRFGKVYTVVNHETGELLAMKELQLQPNDHQAIKKVVQELHIFERIIHENLVRYYGVEIHKEEMLIFMELCPEGTLENFVAGIEGGIPESIIRSYMRQLVFAVEFLHRHAIVHRDIKSANIFLTKEGRSLKLGDFGSAAKMKAQSTIPGELYGFVGTQAYMAPEVFMKNSSVGHGRAVDIWSLGCVLVEMASGQRPWAEYDSNYQIMFKVGMGETPSVPDTLSNEGLDFSEMCLQHNPNDRATVSELVQHLFLKVDPEEESLTHIL